MAHGRNFIVKILDKIEKMRNFKSMKYIITVPDNNFVSWKAGSFYVTGEYDSAKRIFKKLENAKMYISDSSGKVEILIAKK